MAEPLVMSPALRPILGAICPPGSKSITNRALVVAALARGRSLLTGVLDSQDTRIMVEGLARLGIALTHDRVQATIAIAGCGGRPPVAAADLWLENSGTSIRFLTALCCLGHGRFRLDGSPRMRQRPIGELTTALTELGANVRCELRNGCPPVTVAGSGLGGGEVVIGGDVSSQFTSALLMSAPAASGPITILIAGPLVSEPYVSMTLKICDAFGVPIDASRPGIFRASPQIYRGREYAIEPDASAASYFFAAAAVTGGEVTVKGLSKTALQGDVGFVEALRQMGCRVGYADDAITVRGGPLHGIDCDMNAISDTAQTLAAIAPFATGPTRIRNVAHIRHKETDRVAALATELKRIGQDVEEHADGLTITPQPIRPATIATYDDHRMAMSFAVTGLAAPGISIANPECTAKTYPRFFEDLEALVGRR